MTVRQKIVTAITLWAACAFLWWNVVFDRVLVLAGRRYSHDAATQFRQTGTYLRIDDVMRPAAAYGVRVASLVAVVIIAAAAVAIRWAVKKDAVGAGLQRRDTR
jgi:hypothetical protein